MKKLQQLEFVKFRNSIFLDVYSICLKIRTFNQVHYSNLSSFTGNHRKKYYLHLSLKQIMQPYFPNGF